MSARIVQIATLAAAALVGANAASAQQRGKAPAAPLAVKSIPIPKIAMPAGLEQEWWEKALLGKDGHAANPALLRPLLGRLKGVLGRYSTESVEYKVLRASYHLIVKHAVENLVLRGDADMLMLLANITLRTFPHDHVKFFEQTETALKEQLALMSPHAQHEIRKKLATAVMAAFAAPMPEYVVEGTRFENRSQMQHSLDYQALMIGHHILLKLAVPKDAPSPDAVRRENLDFLREAARPYQLVWEDFHEVHKLGGFISNAMNSVFYGNGSFYEVMLQSGVRVDAKSAHIFASHLLDMMRDTMLRDMGMRYADLAFAQMQNDGRGSNTLAARIAMPQFEADMLSTFDLPGAFKVLDETFLLQWHPPAGMSYQLAMTRILRHPDAGEVGREYDRMLDKLAARPAQFYRFLAYMKGNTILEGMAQIRLGSLDASQVLGHFAQLLESYQQTDPFASRVDIHEQALVFLRAQEERLAKLKLPRKDVQHAALGLLTKLRKDYTAKPENEREQIDEHCRRVLYMVRHASSFGWKQYLDMNFVNSLRAIFKVTTPRNGTAIQEMVEFFAGEIGVPKEKQSHTLNQQRPAGLKQNQPHSRSQP